jgi:hypothetical protein
MKRLVLANKDYETHMTDEGNQLQQGLRSAGWILSGYGYDGITDVKEAIDKYNPDIVFIQDFRDWHKDSLGCYNTNVHWNNYQYLKEWNGTVVSVLKDAGSIRDKHQRFLCDEIDADIIVIYYDKHIVESLNPWTKKKKLLRTFHSLDLTKVPKSIPKIDKGVVSGARNKSIYPGRDICIENASDLNLDIIKHPGYHNNKCYTNEFMQEISKYKVSICCSSIYFFALRKIIESVACGCTVITDLPYKCVIPGIDDYLIRIDLNSVSDIKKTIKTSIDHYDHGAAMEASTICGQMYDYRSVGNVLNENILITNRSL